MALNLRCRRGHTLVEMMVTVAIVGVVVLGMSGVLAFINRFHRQASARYAVQRNARVSLDVIQRFLSEARGRSIVIDRFNASQPVYSRIGFTDIDGRFHEFYQDGSRLMKKTVSGTEVRLIVLARGLRQAVFSYPSSGSARLVSIALSFEEAGSAKSSQAFQLAVNRVRIQNPDAL